MSASVPTSIDKNLTVLFNNLNLQSKIKQLEKQINYKFRNPSLLHRALTRQNAIQEQHPDAYPQSFEALEFVGDAALKHAIARLLYSTYDGKATESHLHTETVKLITNDGVLPQIAKKLKLDELIIKGKGELLVTSNILADSLEALLGAISIDCGDQQERLLNVIKHLWQPYIKKTQVVSTVSAAPANVKLIASVASSSAPSQVTNHLQPVVDPTPADYQRIFTGVSVEIPVASFQEYVTKVNDIDRRNIGKQGNPALMMLLDKENLRKENELPKIKILLEQGANWGATNSQGISAADLALLKHGGRDAVLKMISEL